MFHLLHYYIYTHIYICGKEQKRYVTNMSMDGLHPWVIPVRIPSHGNWWNGMAMNQNLGVLVNFLNIETAEWIAECSSPPFLEWQGSKMVVGFPANCSRRWLGSCPSWEWSSYSLFLISTYLNDWLSISPAWTCDIHSWNHTYNIYIYDMLSDSIILYHQLFFCSCLESCGLHHLTHGTIGFPGETSGCQLHPSIPNWGTRR